MGGKPGHQIPPAMGNRDMTLILRDGVVYEKYWKCARRPNYRLSTQRAVGMKIPCDTEET